jgi:hypothetical protein
MRSMTKSYLKKSLKEEYIWGLESPRSSFALPKLLSDITSMLRRLRTWIVFKSLNSALMKKLSLS